MEQSKEIISAEELNEINETIERVAQKYGYDEELVSVLKRIIPVMAEGKKPEIRRLLYKTLEKVPIYIINSSTPTKEDIDKISEEFFTDKDIIIEETDRGEYDNRGVAPGAYEYNLETDENGRPVGPKGFLYVSRLSESQEKLAEVYGTTINLSHLIHELGHAWAACESKFTQVAPDTYVHSIGPYKITMVENKTTNTAKMVSYEGLIMEEILNTISEEKTLLKVLGIKDMQELKEKGYTYSRYQGLGTDVMRYIMSIMGTERFEKYRFLKNPEDIQYLNTRLDNAPSFRKMQQEGYSEQKKENLCGIIDGLDVSDETKDKIKAFIEKYKDVYYGNNAILTPMQKIDNVLNQIFTISDVRYNFSFVKAEFDEDGKMVMQINEQNRQQYFDFMNAIMYEATDMVKEAKEIGEIEQTGGSLGEK